MAWDVDFNEAAQWIEDYVAGKESLDAIKAWTHSVYHIPDAAHGEARLLVNGMHIRISEHARLIGFTEDKLKQHLTAFLANARMDLELKKKEEGINP